MSEPVAHPVTHEETWGGLPAASPLAQLPRALRRALDRRAHGVDDPRYCRLVNGAGDGLPGLVIDRYDQHLLVETSSRAADADMGELARDLGEILGASSLVQRLPGHLPRTRMGSPPRWTRVLEMGTRIAFDLTGTATPGYAYDARELRRIVARLSAGARILDLRCGVGGLFLHAGRGGAKRILALDEDGEHVDLAQENAEANGLWGRARVLRVRGPSDVTSVGERFDLVLLSLPDDEDDAHLAWLTAAVAATTPGGRLAVLARSSSPEALAEAIRNASDVASRVPVSLATPGLPLDFPVVLGSPSSFCAHVIELL